MVLQHVRWHATVILRAYVELMLEKHLNLLTLMYQILSILI